MSEDRTSETKDARPFEERILEKFQLVDERLDREFSNVTIRLGKLEARQYDTKPIWERALAAIVETNQMLRDTNERMTAGFTEVHSEFKAIHLRLDAMDQRFYSMDQRFDAIDSRFDAMDQRFDKQDENIEHQFRKVKRRLEAQNETLTDIRVDQRYVDNRLEKIEDKVFPDDPN